MVYPTQHSGYFSGLMHAPATQAHTTAEALPAAPSVSSPPARIVVQYPQPAVDGGRYPAKRCSGDLVTVEADVFRDGHELLRAVVRYRGPGDERWQETEMHRIDAHIGGNRWA